ncbi:MAG: hypothetical protein JWO73_196 [Candidatus Taylorbacteria bacterium]|nr:hypothetical protein [Candidatus Taylorbacteria bacterium]
MTKSYLSIAAIICILVLAGYSIAKAAPCGAPGTCNAAAPINVGSGLQVKLGGLSVGSFLAAGNSLILGNLGIGTTSSPANLDVVGKIHASDDICITGPTGERCLSDVPEDTTVNLTCSTVAALDTMPTTPTPATTYSTGLTGVANREWWAPVAMPASCKTDAGCVIKEEIYTAKGLWGVRQFDYVQNSTNNNWWSSYQKRGNYVNGDTLATDVISRSTNSNDPNNITTMGMQDDKVVTTAPRTVNEHSADTFTSFDTRTDAGMKIYFCSYDSADAI